MMKIVNPLENAWVVYPSTTVPDPNVETFNTTTTTRSWHVYKNMHLETEAEWHCDCGLHVEPGWQYCPKCGRPLWVLI